MILSRNGYQAPLLINCIAQYYSRMMQFWQRRLNRCVRHFENQSCCTPFCNACNRKCPTIVGIICMPLATFAIILCIAQSSELQGSFQQYTNVIAFDESCASYCGPLHGFPSSVDSSCCIQNGSDCRSKNDCYMEKVNQYDMEFMLYGVATITLSIFVLLYLCYYFLRLLACLGRCTRPQVEVPEEEPNPEDLQEQLIRRIAGNAALFRLPASQSYRNSQQNCSICLGGYDGGMVIRLGCQHLFHESCIRKWMSCNSRCPLCRTSL